MKTICERSYMTSSYHDEGQLIFCFCFDKGSLAHFHGHVRSLKTKVRSF